MVHRKQVLRCKFPAFIVIQRKRVGCGGKKRKAKGRYSATFCRIVRDNTGEMFIRYNTAYGLAIRYKFLCLSLRFFYRLGVRINSQPERRPMFLLHIISQSIVHPHCIRLTICTVCTCMFIHRLPCDYPSLHPPSEPSFVTDHHPPLRA